jgi:hypothetical protein
MLSRLSTVWKRHDDRLPTVMVATVVLWVVWPFFFVTPLSHDHPMHIFKSWLFWHEMLASGRLRGWSHTLGFGFPYGELTPPGAEMWVALFRVLTLGQLSWMRTYALAFAGTLTFAAFATYVFAAHFFGRWAGAVAAIFMILDPGGWAEGGWVWCVDLGVWPVTLGLAFALLALVYIDRILTSGPGRNALWAALAIAGSVLIHQLPVLVYAVAVPFLLLDRSGTRLPPGRVRGVALALALGIGLDGFYFVPMLAHSDVTLDLGVPWTTREELAKRLVDFTAFEHMWPLTVSLGLFGLVLALRQRRPGGFGLAAALGAFLVLSSGALIDGLHVERLSLSLLKIESQRMMQVAKLFAFVFVGHAVASLPALLGPVRTPRRLPPWRAAVRVLVGLALIAPWVGPGLYRVVETQIWKDVVPEGKTAMWGDLKAFFQWAETERATSRGFYRIAYDLPFYNHLSLIAPAFTQTPMYKVGAMPSQQFRSFPMSSEPALYQRLAVKWVLSDHPLGGGDFVHERSFGGLHLHRLVDYHEAPFTLDGPGTAELIHFEPERLVFRLRGTQPDSHLTVHVAGFDRWQATLDGMTLPIRPATALGTEYPFLMELPARDGELTLRYVRRTADWLGLCASLAALVALALGLPPRRLRAARWLATLTAWLDTQSPRLRKTALVALAPLVVVVLVRVARPRPLLPPTSLFSQQPALSVNKRSCTARGELDWACGKESVHAITSAGIYGSHYCIEAAHGPLMLMVNGFQADALYGRYDGGYQSRDGRIQISLNGQKIAETITRGERDGLQFLMYDLRPYANPFGQNLRIDVSGSPLHCFDFGTQLY